MPVLTLDPQHPTLDDHRPGADPLFGTAMGIGAMLAAGTQPGRPCRIEAIKVCKPYILDHDGPHRLTVHVDPSGAAEVRSDVMHFAGQIVPHIGPEPWHAPQPDVTPGVDQASIYRAFFHGPAFQVVGAAKFHRTHLIAQMAQTAPVSHVPPVSRVIEFALQSAGLLELALSGRMLIPDGIAGIDIYDCDPFSRNQPIFAHASQAPTGESNISVWADTLIARVSGYRTVELPFAMFSDRIEALRAALLDCYCK